VFDIEYDQTLDGAIRLDAGKFPSVSWDASSPARATPHDVRLLDHATVVSGNETAATVVIEISGDENMDGGIDWLHLYFLDTRYTVTSTDCRVETQLTATVMAGDTSLPVQNTAGFSAANGIWIERAGTNEEQTTVARSALELAHRERIDGSPEWFVCDPEDEGLARGAEARGHHQHGGRFRCRPIWSGPERRDSRVGPGPVARAQAASRLRSRWAPSGRPPPEPASSRSSRRALHKLWVTGEVYEPLHIRNDGKGVAA
jgi:hypothetical protein